MSTRKIKQVLKKKGYELLDVKVLPWTLMGETEWLILVPVHQQELIIEHGGDYFCEQDFESGSGYFGGDAEYIAEALDCLPDLSKIKVRHHD